MKLLILLTSFVMIFSANPYAHAEADSHAHSVTITVPQSLSISAAQDALDFAFTGNKAGEKTNVLNVVYNIIANGMSQSDGAGAVFAELDQTFDGIDFKASVGAFTKTGGNAELAAQTAGYVPVLDSPTTLAVKTNSTGSGDVIKGALPISYQAEATEELASGTRTQQLTLTLTDI